MLIWANNEASYFVSEGLDRHSAWNNNDNSLPLGTVGADALSERFGGIGYVWLGWAGTGGCGEVAALCGVCLMHDRRVVAGADANAHVLHVNIERSHAGSLVEKSTASSEQVDGEKVDALQ